GEVVFIPSADPLEIEALARPDMSTWLRRHPVRAVIGVPLRAGGETYGALIAARHEDVPFTMDDLELFVEIADRAALALQKPRLCEGERSARERAGALFALTDETSRAATLEAVYEAALDGIGRALGVRRASIGVLDDEGLMRLAAWRGLSERYRSVMGVFA